MIFFRVLLTFVFCVVSAYTLLVVSDHGLNLFSVFFGDMQKISWAGQFNLDFMFMLLFSAIWAMWRHHYSLSGIALGVVAFFGGAPFLCIYLFIQSFQAEGDVRIMLLGSERAGS
jgi:hypothetical protein